jgi:glycosyltransferase involved in cell wall biosynthesis
MNQPPTVLYLLDHAQPGGGETSFLAMMKAWQDSGLPARPVIILPEDGPVRNDLEYMGLEVIRTPYPRRTRYGIVPCWSFSAASSICLTAARLKPVIIHANNVFGMFYGGRAAGKFKIPMIWTCHGWFDIDTRVKAWFAKRHVTHVSCVSEGIREEVARILGPGMECSTDYLGIEPGAEKGPREEIRLRMKVGEKCTLIGVLGRFQKIKGHRFLVDALPAILNRVPELKIWFIGDALNTDEHDTLRELKEKIRRDQLEKHIEFLGFRHDARQLLPALDALVIPSEAESFSMAAVEGLDAGIPVIGPDGWGPREIIASPQTGLRFQPGDADDLAAKIIQILLRDGEASGFDPAAGPERVREYFSVRAHLRRTFGLYHRLTGEECFSMDNTPES